MKIEKTVWVIMSKDRSVIAKGVPRNRTLCLVDEGNMRILTYCSKAKAEQAFVNCGFYTSDGASPLVSEQYKAGTRDTFLEAVQIKMTMEEI